MRETQDYINIMNALEKVYGTLPGKAAVIAVNFFKERFRQGNWIDTSTVTWKARKVTKRLRDKGRALLVKSGKLKRDVHKVYANHNSALISTSTITKDYAKIHNEGGLVNATATIGEHTVKPFTRQRAGRTERVKSFTVKEHTRKIRFRMPKRQYMGASAVMDNKIERMITLEFIKAIKSA